MEQNNEISIFETNLLNEAIFTLRTDEFNASFKKLETLIKKSNKILLVSHVQLDSDAIGSLSSLAAGIKAKHQKHVVILKDRTTIEQIKDISDKDLLIFVDLGSWNRVNTSVEVANYLRESSIKLARIDHHQNENIENVLVDIEDVTAGSSASIITLFLKEMNYDISNTAAKLLFKGIVADTGRLQYSISKTTLLALAVLEEKGIEYKKIYAEMYMKTPETMKARKYILNNYQTTENGVSYYLVDDKLAHQYGFNRGEAAAMVYELEGIVNSPIWVSCNDIGSMIKCRVRSRIIPINSICKKFNGGGHENASSAIVKNKNELAKLLTELDNLVKKYKEKNIVESADNDMENKENIKEALIETYILLMDEYKEDEENLLEFTWPWQYRDYKKYLKKHLSGVQKGYYWAKKNCPELFKESKFNGDPKKIMRRIIAKHDKSKYSKEEMPAYDNHFYNKDKEKPGEFTKAWNHHQKFNKHHWQYWIIINSDGKQKALDIPYENILEMVFDWWSFSWNKGDLYDVFSFYNANKDKMILSDNTREELESILRTIRRKLDELKTQEKINNKEK